MEEAIVSVEKKAYKALDTFFSETDDSKRNYPVTKAALLSLGIIIKNKELDFQKQKLAWLKTKLLR